MTLLSDLHYFEVDLGGSAEELRSALFSGVHGFNESRANDLGLDFSGTLVRVFGAVGPLNEFFQQARTQRLVALCERSSSPQGVPAAQEAVRVTRHRPSQRNQPARVRRFEARNPGVKLKDAPTLCCALAVPMASKSTKRPFLLKLARVRAELSPTVEFNSYGLCAANSSVPLF